MVVGLKPKVDASAARLIFSATSHARHKHAFFQAILSLTSSAIKLLKTVKPIPIPLILPQVFQTFACEHLDEEGESGKSYLRADFRIECYTQTHKVYEIYAAIMIFVCEFG